MQVLYSILYIAVFIHMFYATEKSSMKSILYYCLLLIVLVATIGKGQTPHLSGEVTISMTSGLIEAQLEVTNLPRLKDYSIWLNTGFNVQYFRNEAENVNYYARKYYTPDTTAEAFQYYFPASDGKERFLPDRFTIRYKGAFPIISDTLKAYEWGDDKGIIAFNGKTLRASEQTAWYPILYNRTNGIKIGNYTFNITVNCPDCKTIYLNGASPQQATQATFASRLPVPMLLFAGNYEFYQINQTYFLNSRLSKEQARAFEDWVGRIKRFYEAKLGKVYQKDIVFISSTPVSRRNAWMFVTYPTIAAVGHSWGFEKMINRQNALADSTTITFIAHELAHYYYGTLLEPNSSLRWAFLEGITEYLALKATQSLIGQQSYVKKLASYQEAVQKQGKFTPLSQIKNSEEINGVYRYSLVPLLLTGLERQIGEKRMWQWLTAILTYENPITNYNFLKETLLKSGLSKVEFDQFEKQYINHPSALENLIKNIQ